MTLEQEILEYEKIFFKKEFCGNLQNLEDRIHHEFIEFGKSGQIYNKNEIIKHLNKLDSDRNIHILNFKIKELRNNLIMANYISYENETELMALRTSIWIKDKIHWKLYFHQGTETNQGDTLIDLLQIGEESIEVQDRVINTNIILSSRVKRQLKRYGFDEEEFLKVIEIDEFTNEESKRKHSIIFPIILGGSKYIVSGKKYKTTITIERIEKNHISI